jgi:uncharacterized protein (TIGR02145 family)
MNKFYIALYIFFTSFSYSQIPCPGLDSLSYGNQWYHTVQIGSQCWLKENLNIGIMKQAFKDQTNNDTIEKFCYNNDSNMCNIYGGLYQWREAMQYTLKSKVRGICPVGWHIPASAEYDSLFSFVSRDGNALKKVGEGQGTNTSGFSAMLGGDNELTLFYSLGSNANFWSSNYSFTSKIGHLTGITKTIWNNSDIRVISLNGAYGMSIRCIQDDTSLVLQSPYGGESWLVGSNHDITWGSKNLTNKKFKIDYSTDSGTSWINIISSVPGSDGKYTWTIPNTRSINCKVRITYIDNPYLISISDNTFKIITPCPETIDYGGQTYHTVMIGNHCWFKENLNIGTMIPGTQVPSDSSVQKYCYNNDTANCRIYGGLYVYAPCPVFWHRGDLLDMKMDVLYDGNSLKALGQGSGFGEGTDKSGFSLLLSGVRWSDGTFQDLGAAAYFPYGLVYTGLAYSDIIYYSSSDIGYSEAFPTSVASSIRCVRDDIGPLTLKSPVGGENWLIGSTQKITWSLTEVINVKIDYTTNNGTSWINIIESTPASAYTFNWTIPDTPSKYCKVRISSVDHPDSNSISGNVFRIYKVSTTPCPGIPNLQYGGQTYNTIAIGDQCWMKENLNIGTMINGNLNQTDNGIIEKYCYNDDTVNCRVYGALYLWNEAMQYDTTEGAKGICPTGWHLPKSVDFINLAANVGNSSNDLKAVGQGTGSGTGINASGFSAILSGNRTYDGKFDNFGLYAEFLGSINDIYLDYSNNLINTSPKLNIMGFGVRCINDLKISELPVELILFTGSVINNDIEINWITATEVNSWTFDVERNMMNNNVWQKIGSVNASGNSNTVKEYSYIDKNLNAGIHKYRLKMIDLNGSFMYSGIVTAEVAPPAKFKLSNAYPNPWNPNTTIRYEVPVSIFVTIKIFDALGKEVATLVNETIAAGSHEINFNGKNLTSGIYYYQMKAGNFVDIKKIVLIK